jgi:hypothetical protein
MKLATICLLLVASVSLVSAQERGALSTSSDGTGGASEFRTTGATVGVREGIVAPGAVTVSVEPNPFSASATVSLHLESPSHLNLSLVDEKGDVVRTFVDELTAAGDHTWKLSGERLTAGAYHIVAVVDDDMKTVLVVRE